MNQAKFSMNALLVILTIFSAIGLFVTVALYNMSDYLKYYTEDYPIEGTDLMLHYGTKDPSGIYLDTKDGHAELEVEGVFGNEWGMAVDGDQLYINEYRPTNVGITLSDLVRVDMKTFEKTTLAKNAILRGRCASGELVCVSDSLLPSNKPTENSLCKFYSMSSTKIRPESNEVTILYIDPVTGKTVYSTRADLPTAKVFTTHYLNHTLQEVRG